MPANRSRTERWRQSLANIQSRGGGLEFAIDRGQSVEQTGSDLIWRVRVHKIDDETITLEHPGALGHSFKISKGTKLIGMMAVGQNRWMFRTEVIGTDQTGKRASDRVLMVRMPSEVERCTRRQFDRTSLAELHLPKVNLWPLLDPMSAPPVEIATRMLIDRLREEGQTADTTNDEQMLPEVGPMAEARLANLGGGGVGLLVEREKRTSFENSTLWWLSIDLRPCVPAPLTMAARMVHTHTDSQQNLYTGMAFDFNASVDHQEFVIREIERFIAKSLSDAKQAA